MTYQFDPPEEDVFRLWRAVFALVHVDGEFSDDERRYVERIMDTFSFSNEQKDIINKDLKEKAGVVSLFKKIEQEKNIRQFFVMARAIVWCDNFLHELELKAINQIVDSLGQDVKRYQNELRWVERKPIMIKGHDQDAPHQDGLMQIVSNHMEAFYKGKDI